MSDLSFSRVKKLRSTLYLTLLVLCIHLTSSTASAFEIESSSQKTSHENISREIGIPKTQFFNTRELGFHQQNFAIQRGSDNRIYVQNRTGVLVYDGIGWDSITPYTTTLNRAFALGVDDKVYTVKDNEMGYYSAQGKQWQFTAFLSESHLPDIGRITDVETVDQYVVYLIGDYLFNYHPKTGLRWLDMKNNKLSGLILIKDQFFVMAENKKIYRFTPVDNQLNEMTFRGEFPNSHLNIGARSKNKKMLFASVDGVFQLDPQTYTFTKIDKGIEEWLKNNQIRAMCVLSDGRIILGSKKKGIAVLDASGKALRFISKKNGLKQNWVTGIVEDQNHDLWLSHGGSGISRIELDNISYFNDFLGAEKIEAISRYEKTLFIGSLTTGLSYLKISDSLINQSQFKSLGHYSSVWSLMSHKDGLFVGHTNGIGLISYSDKGNFKSEKLIDAPTVYEVFQSTTNPDVIYGASGKGLLKIEKNNGVWQSKGLLKGFSLALVTMTEDALGQLWLTSHSGVIVRVNELNKWPNSVFKRYKQPELANKNNTLMLLDGKIVIGNKNGFFSSSKSGDILKTKESKSWPKISNGVFHRHFVINDEQVISTNGSHFFLIEKGKNGNVFFDQDKFTRIRTTGVSAVYVDDAGAFWAGGRNGLIRVSPDYKAKNKPLKSPQVHKVLSLQTNKIYFSSANFSQKKINLPLLAEEKNLSFQFGTFIYRDADKLLYRYRLEGAMDDWSNWSQDTRADFTNIPKGDFDFELQSKNDLAEQSEITHFSFKRLPFWYETVWFYTFLTLACLLLVAIFVAYWAKMRTQQLQQRAVVLEKTVEERTGLIALQSKELERLNKARTRFFIHVSHELRTPLTLIIGPLQEILNEQYGKISGRVQQAMELVYRSASSMQSLLNQVLDLSRMESGALSLKLTPIDIIKEIKFCCEPFELLAKHQQITFKNNFQIENMIVNLDPKGLKSIINNLMSNAFKFTPAGGFIELQLSLQNQALIIEINDSGCGIAESELAHVFDQYYQAESQAIKPHSGTGIGLSMVHEYVKLHGGEIELTSEFGKGTRFIVRLPLLLSDGEELLKGALINDLTTVTKSSDLPTIIHQPLKHKNHNNDCATVLIVEDNTELRQFIAHRLGERYRILEAENGQVGLALAKQELPDVIITDIMMPVMDGHALCQSLKSSIETDFIPLVMLTSKGTGEEIVEGINLGADDYLAKPFSMPELLARINRLIESRLVLRQRFSAGEIASLQANNSQTVSEPSESDRFLLRVREIVLTQESEGFGVKELANALAMDRTTLHRKFKNSTGSTATEAMRNIRLEEAAKLFKAQQGNVTEVAYGVGFKSLGHFSRSFSAYFGMSPVAYKTQYTL